MKNFSFSQTENMSQGSFGKPATLDLRSTTRRWSYANGVPYRPLRTRYGQQSEFLPRPFTAPTMNLARSTINWLQFWLIVESNLRRHHYSTQTIQLYRRILRAFVRFFLKPGGLANPRRVTEPAIRSFIYGLAQKHASWSWIASNVSVLRTAFDKLGGLNVTRTLRTPKRPMRLPCVLSPDEVKRLLSSAVRLRDQLLLGLMYGCGLKVGEVCRLRWADVSPSSMTIRVRYGRNTRTRFVSTPPSLASLLNMGVKRCQPAQFIFTGNRQGKHISIRMAEIVLHSAAEAAGIEKPICCMSLRHSYAVHCLQVGMSVRELQQALGHESIQTTIAYEAFLTPQGVVSPADRLFCKADAQVPQPGNTGPVQADQLDRTARPEENIPCLQTEELQLPFPPEPTTWARQFYTMLKIRFSRSLLRRRSPPP